MTTKPSNESLARQPVATPVVKHFRSHAGPRALCNHCEWSQAEVLLAEARLHVRYFPTHTVEVLETTRTVVWAETRDGRNWREATHG